METGAREMRMRMKIPIGLRREKKKTWSDPWGTVGWACLLPRVDPAPDPGSGSYGIGIEAAQTEAEPWKR